MPEAFVPPIEQRSFSEIKDVKEFECWSAGFLKKTARIIAKLESFQRLFPDWDFEKNEAGPEPNRDLATNYVQEADGLLAEFQRVMEKVRSFSIIDFVSPEDATLVRRTRLAKQIDLLFNLRDDVVLQTNVDLRLEEMPEKIERAADKLVYRAQQELIAIAPGLHDLVNRISEEKPDMVFFLDKSARIFGLPLQRYLRTTRLNPLPQIRFYNDQRLKHSYLYATEESELKRVAKAELSEIKGKKVFFVDETYSNGQGAAALFAAEPFVEAEIFYTAITTDPKAPPFEKGVQENGYAISADTHRQNLERIKTGSHFVAYSAPITHLFSRQAARWYVGEHDMDSLMMGKTIALREKRKYEKLDHELPRTIQEVKSVVPSEEVAHGSFGRKPPGGLSWKEYGSRIQKIHLQTIKKIQDLIYQTFNAS